jgi:tripartite-type tricarboxylate transporter receptor subunit TctC
MTEAGYPSVNVGIWTGFSGPPNLPAHVVDEWNNALRDMLKDREIVAKLKNLGGLPFYKGPAEMKEYIRKETADVAELWNLR